MIKFEDTGILTGFIKQKLHSFQLPSVDVLSEEEEQKGTFVDGITYIKDGSFKEYKDGAFKNIKYIAYENKTTGERKVKADDFIFYANQNYPLLTKNLEIKNNRYDSYTHKYLGDYLRFLRDFYDLDLMSLYNCFSNEIISLLDIILVEDDITHVKRAVSKEVIKNLNKENLSELSKFDASDPAYTIYAIPVKFNKTYTIALDSSLGVELMCGFYDKVPDTREDLTQICCTSYLKKSQTFFSKPFLYEVKHSEDAKATIEQRNQANLKLFIKLPFNLKTSIVVLEGNYIGYNDSFLQNGTSLTESNAQYLARYQNYSVANCNLDDGYIKYEDENDSEGTFVKVDLKKFKPISSLQLLRINSGVSYPFSDRLVEYLLEQAITPIDSIDLNINRVQEVLTLRNRIKTNINANRDINSKNKLDSVGYYNDWYNSWKKEHPTDTSFDEFYKDLKPVVGIPSYETKGKWEDIYRVALYGLAVQEKLLNEYNDFLGYVDKDVEQKLKADYLTYDTRFNTSTRHTKDIDNILEEEDLNG